MNRVVVETCRALHDAGHEITLAYHDNHPVQVPCKVIRVPIEWPVLRREKELLRFAREFHPDVIQSHSSKIIGALEELSRDFPTCHFFHDLSWICSALDRTLRNYVPCHRAHGVSCLAWHYVSGCGGKDPRGNWQRWWDIDERVALRKLTRVRFQFASRFMRQAYLENGFAPEQIDVVPLFASEPPRSNPSPENGLLFLPSRLVPAKGVQVALEAMKLLRTPDWKLVVAGDGPQRGQLETWVERESLQDQIQFLGEIAPSEMDQWYARSQIILFPVLRQEPFGLVGVEALAHGRPIVAFSGGAVDEWLWPEETGLCVAERTPSAFAAAIDSLLSNPNRSRQMGEFARNRFAQFTLASYMDRLMNAFRKTQEWHRS